MSQTTVGGWERAEFPPVVTVRKNENGSLSVAVSWKKPFSFILDSQIVGIDRVTSRDVMGPIRRDIVTLIDSRFACFHAYLAA